MKRIPYGVSNFKDLIDEDMYYVDKTSYLEILEQNDKYLFFIRPRRFGKSLFLSMMQTYYDRNEKVNFEKYFGNLYIGKNKTAQANTYLTLRISFATVISDMGKDKLIQSFDNIVFQNVSRCFEDYSEFFGDVDFPKEQTPATFALQYLAGKVRQSGQKLLLLIDEYDNFANNIMLRDRQLYEDLLHGDGYVKTFYKGIKEGAADGAIAKVFVTGVSPIMLDDITSGANIFTVSSNFKDFNAMLGFTQKEVEDMVEYYKLGEIVDREELMELLRGYTNGYRFNDEINETVYNTDMVLYIVKNIIFQKRYPKKLIDENVKTDYTRLRKIAENFITREEMMNIIETGKTEPLEIMEKFNLESLYRGEERGVNLRSLLYYIGMFTIGETEGNKVILKIPNYSVKAMYWDYMNRAYEVEQSANYAELERAMRKLRKTAELEDIMDIYTRVVNRMSNRDLIHFNEASCKGIFITLVHTDGMYLIESEKEASGGYSDLYIKENVLYKEDIHYRFMFEFKHIKQSELKGEFNVLSKEEILEINKDYIAEKEEEAWKQLEQYIKDHNVLFDNKKPLRKVVVITIARRYVLYMVK
jgi:hypothetical protein